jgi:lipoprotein-anchoring transpeptidase ErfK/SrfK
MIHGLPNADANVGPDRYQNDWTFGCIAMRNEEIDEIFGKVEPGTPILLLP